MPYIGNDLATQFQAFATQTITGDGSTGYTLDRAVANGKELLVYINNVKQEEGSGKSYTASGTTITFSAAVASTDSCYLVYMGSAQQTVTAPAGSIVSSQFSSADLNLTGDVGIGVAPTSSYGRVTQIHDTGTSGANLRLTDSTSGSGTGNGFELIQIGVNDYIINRETGFISLYTSGTEAMKIDANGHITKPLQSAFSVRSDTNNTNFALNTTHTVTFSTEIFDQNADFASNTFTAPVTGRYQLSATFYFEDVASSADYLQANLVTSNRTYYAITDPTGYDTTVTYHTYTISVLADMDANDTATMSYRQPSGGDQQIDLNGSHTYFTGFLAC